MRVVADSHAIVWYTQGSHRISDDAAAALSEAETTGGIVVSVATLIDLWYVTQTTRRVTEDDLSRLRAALETLPKVIFHPVDVAVADACTAVPCSLLTDPWDRLIVATAKELKVPLVTCDRQITAAKVVETIW